MGLKDWLFGKKVRKTDDFFGEIESCRFKANRSTSVSWHIHYQMPCFEEETYIILEGDKNGPNPALREEVIYFLLNYETFYTKEIDNIVLYNNEFSKLRHWRQDYELDFICDYDYEENITVKFEVSFSSKEEVNKGFCFIINNRKIEEFEISGE